MEMEEEEEENGGDGSSKKMKDPNHHRKEGCGKWEEANKSLGEEERVHVLGGGKEMLGVERSRLFLAISLLRTRRKRGRFYWSFLYLSSFSSLSIPPPLLSSLLPSFFFYKFGFKILYFTAILISFPLILSPVSLSEKKKSLIISPILTTHIFLVTKVINSASRKDFLLLIKK